MHRILVPIDFSERSQSVLNHLTTICHPKDYHYTFYHVYAKTKTEEILISIDDIIESEIKVRLEDHLTNLKIDFPKSEISYDLIVDKGELIESLQDNCMDGTFDMIVFGSNEGVSWKASRDGKELNTMNVIDRLECPILLIPFGSKINKPKNILFARKLFSKYSELELRPLLNLMKTNGAHLDLLSFEKDRTAVGQKEMEQASIWNDFDVSEHETAQHDSYEGIQHFSNGHAADIICIMHKKENILERILKESTTRKVISEMNKPLLVLKEIKD